MRLREQWLALAVLLTCLWFADVAPPEFVFGTGVTATVPTPSAIALDHAPGP